MVAIAVLVLRKVSKMVFYENQAPPHPKIVHYIVPMTLAFLEIYETCWKKIGGQGGSPNPGRS